MSDVVLIVDDSLTVRMDLTELFEAAGLASLACASLAEARDRLLAGGIGLLILDVLLPDGNGVDFLRELRTGQYAKLPVLLLSSEAEVKDRILGLTTGANEYVGKPYDGAYIVAKAQALLGTPHDETGRTVLIVDDSQTYREALSDRLVSAGYAVLTADSGRAGLAILASRRLAALIVDGVMPDMDGASLIRRIRLDAASRNLPCILLTASDDPGSQLRALDAGADAFVRKDEEMDVVLARLAVIMRSRSEKPAEQVTSLSGPRKILAVDDSETYLNEIADRLRQEGYEVSLARSGEEAIELLTVQPVDCILMDLVMPGMGGRAACARIKSAAGVRDIPLILLTAHEERSSMLEGLSAGADDYIPKSSEFEVLCARVLAQIRRRQYEDENRRYREELLERELAAAEERSARILAEARAAMVDELQQTIDQRTRELEASVVDRRHAERMASVGMLAASVAHEINNPLAIVIGNLELMRLSLTDLAERSRHEGDLGENGLGDQFLRHLGTADDPLRDSLEAAERVRQIVGDLRIFARSDDDAAEQPADIHKVLEAASRMASHELRHRATLLRDFGAVPLVNGSESRLGQVFLNLIVNAAQAMPVGRAADNEIRLSTSVDAGGRVAIEVADTGVGIPAEKLDRVFDPFFTTKPAGVGTGLGLAICHRIVSELGGTITVRSTVGEGTKFRIVLPAATGHSTPLQSTQATTSSPSGARRRILVVDDEPSLCRTIGRVLSAEHEVTTITSPVEALGLIESGRHFDLILSDLMMPEMSGLDLHAQLLRIAPEQAARMIFMSGGAFSVEAEAFLAARPYRVEKPFLPATLRDVVHRALVERPLAA